jgi:hypothetical protein
MSGHDQRFDPASGGKQVSSGYQGPIAGVSRPRLITPR